MTTLALLPRALLDAILSFDATHAVIKLWLSGDKTLLYKISTGVTSVELLDAREYTKSRLPTFIGQLRALRSLSIDRQDKFLPYFGLDYGKFIQQLPSSLTKLSLAIYDSIRVLSPNLLLSEQATSPDAAIHDTDIDMNKIGWTFATAFPHLSTLDLRSGTILYAGDFALLPPTITHLTLSRIPKYADGEYSSKLPRQLLTLEVVGEGFTQTRPSFWAHLPPQLTCVSLPSRVTAEQENHDGLPLSSKLPRTLTRIEMPFLGLVDFTVDTLPSGLEQIDMDWMRNQDEDNYRKLGSLFPHLKEIEIRQIRPSILRALPPSLLSLDIALALDFESIEPKFWPSSLTHLSIYDIQGEFPLSSLLPSHGLVMLTLPEFSLDITLVTHLPRSLTFLYVGGGTMENWSENSEITFPPNLSVLSIQDSGGRGQWLSLKPLDEKLADGSLEEADDDEIHPTDTREYRLACHGRTVSKCFPYYALPQSVTHLEIPTLIPASQLKFLPHRLKLLNIDDIFEDSDYHPYDTIEMDAMKANFEVVSAEGVKESFDWKLLERSSIATLLPRCLNRLFLWGDAMAFDLSLDATLTSKDDSSTLTHSVFDWSHLPPKLFSLNLRSSLRIPGRLLDSIPLQHTTNLTLSLTAVEEAHLASIPSFLTSGNIMISSSPNLTPMILQHPSANFFSQTEHYDIMQVADRLKTLRKEKWNDEDSAEYLSLCFPDKSTIEKLWNQK